MLLMWPGWLLPTKAVFWPECCRGEGLGGGRWFALFRPLRQTPHAADLADSLEGCIYEGGMRWSRTLGRT